jgi:hypothetical protein
MLTFVNLYSYNRRKYMTASLAKTRLFKPYPTAHTQNLMTKNLGWKNFSRP